jgi:uncharacterized protein YkwD
LYKAACAAAVVAALVVCGVAPAQAAARIGATSTGRVAGTAGPSDLVSLVNSLRASVNVAPLSVDPAIASVAQQWANHLASTGSLVHNPSLSTQVPSGWTKVGENIGNGPTLLATYNALVASTFHYANMVDPLFNRTGVGVATDTVGQVWVVQDFGDYPPPVPAAMTFPTPGTVIFPSAQNFTWNQAPGAVYYCLTVGTTQGGVDLLNSGLLYSNQLSYSVPALPGGPLWARLYTWTQGNWIWTDVSFSVTGAATATFTNPTAGATNVNTAQPFTWAPVASAVYYGVTVGTTQGGADLVSTGPLPASQTSYSVPALPAGRTLWARIYSYIDGSWLHYRDISFTAAPR